jgi:hypothetical protein
MPQFGTKQLDIRDQNVAVERVLEATENPRHRYLLQSYLRHRYLESAGRYQEILVPEMTVEHPYYRFSLIGQPRFTLDGRAQVEAVYQHWTQTDQCVFYVEDESVAVGDHLIVAGASATSSGWARSSRPQALMPRLTRCTWSGSRWSWSGRTTTSAA